MGSHHTCALLGNKSLWCWGSNAAGQLGNDRPSGSLIPVRASRLSTATAISSGGQHTCAILANGSVSCWGSNSDGQLGLNSPMDYLVSGISTATAISSGGQHNCAILANGSVQCWGLNNYGQLGNNSTDTPRVPVTVTGILPLMTTTFSLTANEVGKYLIARVRATNSEGSTVRFTASTAAITD